MVDSSDEWTTMFDDNAQAYFSYNTRSGETVWENPQQTADFQKTQLASTVSFAAGQRELQGGEEQMDQGGEEQMDQRGEEQMEPVMGL